MSLGNKTSSSVLKPASVSLCRRKAGCDPTRSSKHAADSWHWCSTSVCVHHPENPVMSTDVFRSCG